MAGEPGFEIRFDATRGEAANDDATPDRVGVLRGRIRRRCRPLRGAARGGDPSACGVAKARSTRRQGSGQREVRLRTTAR